MIFQRLSTEGFINLPDRAWKFRPGLQLVRGPNEAGKTALRRALTLAVFQDATTSDKKVLALTRWGASSMKLRLEFEYGGVVYSVVRDFEARTNLLESADGALRLKNKEKIREQIRQMLPIPDEAAFRATACMAWDELRIEDASRIHNLIEERVISAGGINVVDIIRGLEAASRQRHKGEARAAQHPGIFREIEDKLAELNREQEATRRQLDECEHAANELKAREEQLAAAQAQLKILRERESRDKLHRQAVKEVESMAKELLRIEEDIKKAEKLDTEIDGLQQQLAVQEPPLRTLEQEVRNAEQLIGLQQRIAAATQEAERLQAQSDAVGRLRQRLAELRAEADALPIRKDEAENAFYRLPGEIAALQKALDHDRAEQEKRKNDIAAAEELRVDIGERLVKLASEKRPLEEARGRAIDDAATRKQVADAEQQLHGEEELVRQLETIERELKKAGAEAVELPEEGLRRLHAGIEAYAKALSGERIVIWAEGAERFRASADGQDEVALAAGQEVRFQRRARLVIGEAASVTVENRNKAAARLEAAQNEMAALLRDCSCNTYAEFEAAAAKAAPAREKQIELQSRRSTLLAGRKPDEIRRNIDQLTGRIAELKKKLLELAVTPEDTGKAEEGLRELDREERDLHKQEAAAQARLSVLRGVPEQSASMRQNEEELHRKQSILKEILERASVQQPAELRELVETIDRIERDRLEAEAALARQLGGARADDVALLLEKAVAKAALLQKEQDALAAPPWPLADLDQEKRELKEAQSRYGAAGKQKEVAERLRQQLDIAKLNQRRDLLAIDLVAAKPQKERYEQFRMDPEEALRVEQQIQQIDAQMPALHQQIGTFGTKAEREEGLRDRLAELQEKTEWLKGQRGIARFRDATDGDVQQLLEQARVQAVSKLRSRLPELTGEYLSRATRGRHTRLDGDGLSTCIHSDEKGGVIEDHELSSGTADQLYVATRLAAVQAMFGDTPPPLLIDDVLVHCDPARRAAVLQLLAEFASRGQAILFTCQDYAEYAGLPSIDIGVIAAAG